MTTKRQSSRQLRERKHKKLYSEDWALGDEEIEGRRSFSLQEKLENPAFAQHSIVKEMHGSELTVAYLQRHGFSTPLLFKEKTGLGLRVPTTNFTVNDVRMCVGSRRVLDVMDVNTQKNAEMTMKEWQKYYDDPEKTKLLNVISLEFSHTKLENYVHSPSIVRQVDWVDNVWPGHLKDSQVEATNLIEDMKYPKVQKYCLMSVKACYTDFHVDFGGTSVWYHILKGGKVFWLIPPTEQNLELYERWVLSGKQSDVFFGDTVERCARIELRAGNTFFIPTGWIHAVYTPQDSLVFGGNFLHSFGIDKQLKIAQVEDATKVPQKFRYPFFTEMLWYVLERYVHCLLGRSHLTTGSDFVEARPHVHLTHAELHGLKEIVLYLHMLPNNKKNLPELIKDPVALIQDVRTLIGLHRSDNREAAITGQSAIFLPDDSKYKQKPTFKGPTKPAKYKLSSGGNNGTTQGGGASAGSGQVGGGGDKGGPRRRRTRCKKCEACVRSDCGECSFCLDMVKFGGPGRAKQTCNMRQCLQPMLPITAACAHCALDGWGQTPMMPLQKTPLRCESASSLMECSVCYEIAHPECVQRVCHAQQVQQGCQTPQPQPQQQFAGYVNEDMPNSWECPLCCKLGKNTDYRPRHFRARQKSSEVRRMSISSDVSSLATEMKTETKSGYTSDDGNPNHNLNPMSLVGNPGNDDSDVEMNKVCPVPIKKRRSSGNGATTPAPPQQEEDKSNRNMARLQLAKEITAGTQRILKKPMYVVRPAPQPPAPPTVSTAHHTQDRRIMIPIFRYLKSHELYTCALVCKTWATFTVDPALWRRMNFSQKQLSSDVLKGIVRRQPEVLILDWCHINKYQLPWLIQRSPGLRELSLVSINVASVISLRTCYCAQLLVLDVSFVSGFGDSALREILLPNNDHRQVYTEDKIRLRSLHTLHLAGTDVSDVAMRYVTQYLPNLQHLSLSTCARISDAGIAQLTTRPAHTVTQLRSLDLSHAKLVTELSLEHLAKCTSLTRLDLRHSAQVSTQALIKFAARSERDLQVRDVKLVDIRVKKT